MSWIDHHAVSQELASDAEIAAHARNPSLASELYARAADAEEEATKALNHNKTRTLGISCVSAASLYYKAGKYDDALRVASYWLTRDSLPAFAREELMDLVNSIYNEQRTTLLAIIRTLLKFSDEQEPTELLRFISQEQLRDFPLSSSVELFRRHPAAHKDLSRTAPEFRLDVFCGQQESRLSTTFGIKTLHDPLSRKSSVRFPLFKRMHSSL